MIKPTFTLHHGDCVEVMRSMPAESVDAIVTSPPYAEQRKATYGGIPESEYPAWTVSWMAEAMRILKPNGSVILNVRPHIQAGVISDYVLRTRLALRGNGWAELEELIWDKVSGPPLGSPNRPRRNWESLLWFGKHGRAFCDPKAAGEPAKRPTHVSGGRAKKNDWAHVNKINGESFAGVARVSDIARFSTGLMSGDKGVTHPATFPWQLAEWCGKLICPPGGTILDPFSGSGSTGVAAVRNGWDYIGIDAVEEYVNMSKKRLEGEAA